MHHDVLVIMCICAIHNIYSFLYKNNFIRTKALVLVKNVRTS